MGKSLEEKKKELMTNPEFVKAYDKMKAEFEEERKRIEQKQ